MCECSLSHTSFGLNIITIIIYFASLVNRYKAIQEAKKSLDNQV